MNPYAAQLSYGDDRLQGRRDQPKYLNLIKAIAFLRQMRKPVKMNRATAPTYLEADLDDIRAGQRAGPRNPGQDAGRTQRAGPRTPLQTEEPGRGAAEEKKPKPADEADAPRSCVSFTRREVREFTGWSQYPRSPVSQGTGGL